MRRRKIARFKKQVHNYLFDHMVLKYVLEYGYNLLICAVSAIIFAFGFSTFAAANDLPGSMNIVTGGASGMSQSVKMIIELCIGPDSEILRGVGIESILYTVLNIPLIIFAFRKVGVRFAILTLINVGLSSMFMPIIREWSIVETISQHALIGGQPLTRALFAGVCTGTSTALAFKGLFSTGGLDIISYYISIKKSSGAGKYAGILNVINITIYTVLFISSIMLYGGKTEAYATTEWPEAVVSFLYGLVYLVVVMFVVDLINVRNKKVQVQIVTQKENLSKVLIANFPHSVTIANATGAYSKTPRFILTMTISSSELKKVVKVVQKTDPNAFIQALSLYQVYGKFYMTPIK